MSLSVKNWPNEWVRRINQVLVGLSNVCFYRLEQYASMAAKTVYFISCMSKAWCHLHHIFTLSTVVLCCRVIFQCSSHQIHIHCRICDRMLTSKTSASCFHSCSYSPAVLSQTSWDVVKENENRIPEGVGCEKRLVTATRDLGEESHQPPLARKIQNINFPVFVSPGIDD